MALLGGQGWLEVPGKLGRPVLGAGVWDRSWRMHEVLACASLVLGVTLQSLEQLSGGTARHPTVPLPLWVPLGSQAQALESACPARRRGSVSCVHLLPVARTSAHRQAVGRAWSRSEGCGPGGQSKGGQGFQQPLSMVQVMTGAAGSR